MNANLAYWTVALGNMALVVAFAWRGVRQVRRGEVACHRRSMSAAGALVLLFVLSYVAKVALLGREDRSAWAVGDVATLYVHESCVGVMLVAGVGAGLQALRLRRTRRVTGAPADPPAAPATLRRHRRFGWTAVVAAALGLATAAAVLWGMYRRAGLG